MESRPGIRCPPAAEEILRVVKDEILTTKEAWTQGGYAKDSTGRDVSIQSGKAVSYCLVGACRRAAHVLSMRHCYTAAYLAEGCLSDVLAARRGSTISPIGFNDAPGRTFEEVRALLDEALGESDGGKAESSETSPA